MQETWKEIKGFNDYHISSDGKIRKHDKTIKKYIKTDGYVQCTLYKSKDKTIYKKYIHRLVAEAFIPNPNNYPCVNHKNGIKTDNRVENLEWCTYSQNMTHAVATNLLRKRYGQENKLSKEYVELDENYNFIREFTGSREENKKLGYSKDTIQRCARGKTLKTHNKIYLLKEEYYFEDVEKTKQQHILNHEKYKKGGIYYEKRKRN